MISVLGTLDPSTTDLPLYSFQVPAGFPSPVADHLEKRLSLDELLDVRAPHIYLVRVEGDSMIGAGIYPGDLVLVDRSIPPEPGHIVIAAVNCEPLCKRLAREGSQVAVAVGESALGIAGDSLSLSENAKSGGSGICRAIGLLLTQGNSRQQKVLDTASLVR